MVIMAFEEQIRCTEKDIYRNFFGFVFRMREIGYKVVLFPLPSTLVLLFLKQRYRTCFQGSTTASLLPIRQQWARIELGSARQSWMV